MQLCFFVCALVIIVNFFLYYHFSSPEDEARHSPHGPESAQGDGDHRGPADLWQAPVGGPEGHPQHLEEQPQPREDQHAGHHVGPHAMMLQGIYGLHGPI